MEAKDLYEKDYRNALGFTNKENIKKYFKGTDIICINWSYIEQLNLRLIDIFRRINSIVHESIRPNDYSEFSNSILSAYSVLRENNIISRLNNFGRTHEDVYFNWMRGYCVATSFTKAISIMLNVDSSSIHNIGMDSLDDIKTFSQSPTADIEVKLNNESFIRLEIQSGFTGINDIKKHKVTEAKRVYNETNIRSYIVHFDLFNGKAAVIDLSEIEDNNINYRINERFEGQIVFSIPDEAFMYKLTDAPVPFSDLIYIP